MSKGKELRFPRGMGITDMASLANKGDNEALVNLTKYAIQTWLIHNGKLWNRNYSTLELSEFLNCEPVIIQNQMRDAMLNSKLFDRSKANELMDSLTGALVNWALEDRMEIGQQVDILKSSQGDSYVPFVSSEVTKAIALKQSSTTQLQGLLRTLSGGGSVNIFNQQNNQYNQVSDAIITREEAMGMIQKEIADRGGVKEIEYVEAQYDFQELPVVVATKQEGSRGDKEGLTLKNHEIDAIVSDYAGATKAFEIDHHEIRREIEENIDIYAEDPEMA